MEGYKCEFIEPPVKQLQSECSICRLVLREPHIVSCCGISFCKECIGRVQSDRKPCPVCNEPGFMAMANKALKRDLNEFQVRCSHRELGCEWVGEMGKLNQHFNADPQPERQLEGCQFTSIKCIYCKDCIRRHVISGHQNECPKRTYTCPYCEKYESTFEDVADHWAECKCYLLPCPNNCNPSGSGIERQNLEHHVKEECPLTVVECDFHYAGCGVKLPRKDMTGHIKEESVVHISLLAAENQRLAKQLLEQQEANQELSQTLQQQQAANQELALRPHFIPIFMKMDGFKKFKRKKLAWFSTPFYTHMCGYKMCLRVYASGYDIGEGTHISVYTCLMCGEFDSDLKWPFRGAITIQLLNQLEDREHCTHTTEYTDEIDDDVAARVTVGDRSVGWGRPQFISQLQLSFNHAKHCQYLKDDCLFFRILAVKVQK